MNAQDTFDCSGQKESPQIQPRDTIKSGRTEGDEVYTVLVARYNAAEAVYNRFGNALNTYQKLKAAGVSDVQLRTLIQSAI